MVMDFGFIKQVMMEEIHDPCDHGLVLCTFDTPLLSKLGYNNVPLGRVSVRADDREFLKLYTMDSVPTAENLAKHWYERVAEGIVAFLAKRLADQGVENQRQYIEPIRLEAVIVHETPNSVATYRREFPGVQHPVGLGKLHITRDDFGPAG